jgi:1,2-diacylglycerol 3-beta-galactosyltransferase
LYFSTLIHSTIHQPSVDKCFVPTDVLKEKAQSRGLDATSQIVQYGLPIRKGFWPTNNRENGATSSKRRREIPFLGRTKRKWKEVNSNSSLDSNANAACRERLGLEVNLPTCLVVGGGDGMGGIVDIATILGKKLGQSDGGGDDDEGPMYQMVVVCGKNQQAQRHLETMDWGPGVQVNVQGFVNNMDEFMHAADCLVTKAGPGTIAEACICGLPCMLFAYL